MVKPINHILVVDDEAEFVNTINRHLKREGFIMDSASGVEEARRKIDASLYMQIRYDLVITDIAMPNLGAIEILRWIRKKHPKISVIVVTGFGDNDMLRETMRQDLDAYAKKPLTPQKMIGLINSLRQKRGKN
jgi:two-component system response regulator YesN